MNMDVYELIDNVAEKAERFVKNLTPVSADQLGLDIRAGYRLYVDCDCIAVSQSADRALQYYGGFEYIDKEYRHAFGDWVIYTVDSDRVADCIEAWTDGIKAEIEAEEADVD